LSRILVIEDDPGVRGETQRALRSLGHDVDAVDASSAIALLDDHTFDVVVAGLEPTTTQPATTPPRSRPVPQELVCLPRPLSTDVVVEAIGRLENRAQVRKMFAEARYKLDDDRRGSPIVGRSPAMRLVHGRVSAVAVSDAPVLLTGESGTGKELLAQTIHSQSRRRDKPLVVVNCAAFPETLIEAELFGHEKGAFTGALHKRDGRFKAADGGTLFLDEINGLSLAAQAKLLRVLQDGTFCPIGTNTEVSVDVRLISATNRELKSLVTEGQFREDLYYRIKVLDIELPPLRERTGDLPLLVSYFLLKHAPPGRKPILSPGAWAAVCANSFPGNVRELEHAIQHAIVLARGLEIEVEHLPRDIAALVTTTPPRKNSEIQPLSVAVREFEREYVMRALQSARGNKTKAARMLGMSRKHLWEKLRRLMSPDDT
jgi:two-component system, NtrC family, response regulator HydG